MFKSSKKRNDPYGIKPMTRDERLMMTHGDPVTIKLARKIADSRPDEPQAPTRTELSPSYAMHDPVYWS